MYYMMTCLSPDEEDHALMSYIEDDPSRSWHSGTRFAQPPPQPIRVEVQPEYPGLIPELNDEPLPFMTKRMLAALHSAGVTNLDTYQVVIYDPTNNTTYENYVAFNVIGTIAAADLNQSSYDTTLPERMISMDFDSVVIDEQATRGALMFRLAESVNAIVVHEKVKQHLEASGIDTLTFIPPEEWAG
jgi:hypothetical protein